MKSSKLIFLAILILFSTAISAFAIPVTFTFTADNVVLSWWYTVDGGDPIPLTLNTTLSGYDDDNPDTNKDWKGYWDDVDTGVIYIESGHVYEIIWLCVNADTSSNDSENPGGFLAQASGDLDMFENGLLTTSADSYWDLSTDLENWESVYEWGENKNANGTLWTQVSGIDESAQWIWTELNMEEGQPTPEDDVYIRLTIDTTPVPEPATVLLLGLGLIVMGGIGRNQFTKK